MKKNGRNGPGIEAYRADNIRRSVGRREPVMYAMSFDPVGVDDPTDERELVLVKRYGGSRIAFFRDEEWYMTGTIKGGGEITLWQEDI
jgi:hypothetical protein